MQSTSRGARKPYRSSRLSVLVAGGLALSLAAAMLATSAAATSRLRHWSPPVNLSSSGGHSPDLAVSADGTTAVAVWLRKKDRHRVVQARTARIVDGAVKWSPKQDLSAVGAPTASSPTVAVSGDGDTAVVVWTQGWTSVRARTARISKGTASWSAKQTVASSVSESVSYSQVVMSRDGSTVIATWIRGHPGTPQVGQSRSAFGSVMAPRCGRRLTT